MTTCWPLGGIIMTGSGVNPPFCDRFLTLCTKMPTTWGLMTHSNLYKDKMLDNRSPGRSLAYTGSYPHDRKLPNVTGNGPKNNVKLNFSLFQDHFIEHFHSQNKRTGLFCWIYGNWWALSPPIAFEVDLASTLEAIDTENEQQSTLLLSVFSRCFSSNILETYTWPLVEINL